MNRPQRVHWLQHAEHEELGCIGPWLAQRGHRVTHTRLYAGEPLPELADFDWLMVMGGPMNIYEHERFPWLAQEKILIHDACVTKKKVLGICLGAQLIADAMGGRVSKSALPEIGFFNVKLTKEGSKSTLFNGFPMEFTAFHWHGDTFTIPLGSHNLINSDACVNQAFMWGDRVVAVQFHMEVTAGDARCWLALETPEPARTVQPAAEILSDPARFDLNNELMIRLLQGIEALA